MAGERLKEQWGPGSKPAAEKERLRRKRRRIGRLMVIFGLVLAAVSLGLWLYSRNFLHLLYLPAGLIVALLGWRISRSNPAPVVHHDRIQQLRRMKLGYARLQDGVETLLAPDVARPADRLILRALRRLAVWRLSWIERALPPEEAEIEARLKANMLQAQVEAALQGHELGSWEPADAEGIGWQARCGLCGRAIYASGRRLYSRLAERCPG